MTLINQGGSLLLRNGALATGQACCCGGCSGPCSDTNPCQPSCVCDYSSATTAYRCIRNGVVDPLLTTEAACEECATECDYNQCDEYMHVEEGQSCPEGWMSDGYGGCYRTTYPSSCSQCNGYCYSEGCTSTGNCGQWTQYQIGNCVAAPNCCEAENVQLQITLEISGMADGTLTGCGCLDGTYVADVVDWVEYPGISVPGSGSGAKLLLQPGCVATDANGDPVPGQVALEWLCTGTYGLADWGFRLPPQPGAYPLTDQMRVTFSGGVACVGGQGDDPDYFAGGNYKNPVFGGCDTSGLYAKVTIQ